MGARSAAASGKAQKTLLIRACIEIPSCYTAVIVDADVAPTPRANEPAAGEVRLAETGSPSKWQANTSRQTPQSGCFSHSSFTSSLTYSYRPVPTLRTGMCVLLAMPKSETDTLSRSGLLFRVFGNPIETR